MISSIDNLATVRSNGLFIGVATGAGATNTTGSGLYNNTASAVGLRLFDNSNAIVRDGATGGTGVLQVNTTPTVASVEDGFTFTLTVRSDDTYDASTIGLSTEISITGDALGAAPTFDDFINGGIGFNASTQGNGITGGVGASAFTFDSVELSFETIPEPSTSMLVGLVSGFALFGRRRRSL